jgi:hypothetical protein
MASIFPISAERVFEMVEKGQRVELRLQLGTPRSTGENFLCSVQILGIQGDKVFEIVGEDSLQALQLAVKFAGTLLQAEQEQGSKITWLGVDDLGLGIF